MSRSRSRSRSVFLTVHAICARYISLYNSTLRAPKMLNKDDLTTIPTASQRSLSLNQRGGYKNKYFVNTSSFASYIGKFIHKLRTQETIMKRCMLKNLFTSPAFSSCPLRSSHFAHPDHLRYNVL